VLGVVQNSLTHHSSASNSFGQVTAVFLVEVFLVACRRRFIRFLKTRGIERRTILIPERTIYFRIGSGLYKARWAGRLVLIHLIYSIDSIFQENVPHIWVALGKS